MSLILILAISCMCQEHVETSSTSNVQLVHKGKTVPLPYVRAARFEPSAGPPRLHLLIAAAAPVGVVLADSFGEDP